MKKVSGKAVSTMTVKDLPLAERPRERLQKFGPEALSAQEILAVILGRGIAGESVLVTAQRLLREFGSLKGLSEASVEQLGQVNGIGPAKATQLKAAFELARRIDGYGGNDPKVAVKTPAEVMNVVKGTLLGRKKEHFLALLLDTRGQLIKMAEISIGNLDSSLVHPREVFKEATAASAASIIVVHNHPSGDPEPSEDDIEMTRRLAEAGRIMGIEVLDHVIVGDSRFISLKSRGVFS